MCVVVLFAIVVGSETATPCVCGGDTMRCYIAVMQIDMHCKISSALFFFPLFFMHAPVNDKALPILWWSESTCWTRHLTGISSIGNHDCTVRTEQDGVKTSCVYAATSQAPEACPCPVCLNCGTRNVFASPFDWGFLHFVTQNHFRCEKNHTLMDYHLAVIILAPVTSLFISASQVAWWIVI